MSDEIIEYKIENYQKECDLDDINCTLFLEIKQRIPQPIYVFYQVDNLYQNHRRYVKSRSPKQLGGNYFQANDTNFREECEPIITNDDNKDMIKTFHSGRKMT